VFFLDFEKVCIRYSREKKIYLFAAAGLNVSNSRVILTLAYGGSLGTEELCFYESVSKWLGLLYRVSLSGSSEKSCEWVKFYILAVGRTCI
jgi:hypothetical protein